MQELQTVINWFAITAPEWYFIIVCQPLGRMDSKTEVLKAGLPGREQNHEEKE
jgi:hypothetical protein